MKDYIEDLAARQVHRERLKQVRLQPFRFMFLRFHVPARAPELFFYTLVHTQLKKRMASMASLDLSRLQGTQTS